MAEIVDQMREQLYPDGRIPGDSVPQLSSVVLVDRSVDLLTPLFTQLTLEGLVDQLYGIENGEEGQCVCVWCVCDVCMLACVHSCMFCVRLRFGCFPFGDVF